MNAKSIFSEMEQEFVSTKNLLKIIPEDKLNYKPRIIITNSRGSIFQNLKILQ